MKRFISLLLALFALPALAGGLVIRDDWAPPSANPQMGVAYLTIVNDSGANDALTGAVSSCCEAVEIHEHQMNGAVMRMRKVNRLPLPKGETVTFAPHGLHLMLIGLKKPLTEGDRFPVTLHFEKAKSQRVEITVSRAGLQSAAKSPNR